MPGIIILSSSGSDRRAAWWTRLRAADTRWELVLPTARQVELMRGSYPFWAATFAALSTLDAVALDAAAKAGLLAPEAMLDGEALARRLGDGPEAGRAARAIIGWQHAGFAEASELPATLAATDPARLWAAHQARSGPVTSAPWAALMLARRGKVGDGPNVYLENFATASRAAIGLLHALAAARSVIVRVRDLVEVPPIEGLFQPFVERLAARPDWTGQQDDPPPDALERQALAQHLFGASEVARPPRPPGLGPKEVAFERFPSPAHELAAIGVRATKLVADGAFASNIAVALPDAEPYASAPSFDLPADITRLTHRDLAAWTGTHLFMAGLDGTFEAPMPGTEGDETPAHLPTCLLDAVEGARATLWLSACGAIAPELAEPIGRLAPRAWG